MPQVYCLWLENIWKANILINLWLLELNKDKQFPQILKLQIP